MNITSEQPKIIVVGSSSIDLVLNTEHHPQPNETVMAIRSESFFWRKWRKSGCRHSKAWCKCIFYRLCGNGSLWSANSEKSG